MDERKLLYFILAVSLASLVVGLLILYSLKIQGLVPGPPTSGIADIGMPSQHHW